LAPVLIQEMGGAYSELRRAEAFILATMEQEEIRFRRTLGRGLSLLDEESAGLVKGDALSGKAAFTLYDTYGFPVDLTQDVLRARDISVDMDGFNAAMDEQKALARAAWSGSGSAGTDGVWLALKDEMGGTEFLGYAQDEAAGQLTAIVVDGARVDTLQAGQNGELIFNQTPFYAESGGQAGDTGTIRFDNGAVFEVSDTPKRAGAIHAHKGTLVSGTIKRGDAAMLVIDTTRRNAIRANHSATHLMHAALQNVLGPHVTQKGSLVEADRFRFDFAHGAGMSRAEIDAVEAQVNAIIRQNSGASTRLMTPDEAIAEGAMALFGEKYGDEVRVLAMGQKLETPAKSYSVELCGGTHVERVGDIGAFVILSEGAVAAGVRRVEAATGQAALDHLKGEAALARAAAEPLKAQLPDLPARIEAMIADRKRLEKELAEAKKALALGGSGGAVSEIVEINGIKLDARILDGIGAKDLRPMVNEAIQRLGYGVVAYIAVADGKAAIAVASTVASVSAVDLVKAGVLAMGGQGGGGKPDFAQGGAPTGDAAEAGLAAVKAGMGA
jgi:alanyl-tRNA synthetase